MTAPAEPDAPAVPFSRTNRSTQCPAVGIHLDGDIMDNIGASAPPLTIG